MTGRKLRWGTARSFSMRGSSISKTWNLLSLRTATPMRSYTEAGSPVRKCRRQSESYPRFSGHPHERCADLECSMRLYAKKQRLCRMLKESMPARQAKQLVLDMCQINANPR